DDDGDGKDDDTDGKDDDGDDDSDEDDDFDGEDDDVDGDVDRDNDGDDNNDDEGDDDGDGNEKNDNSVSKRKFVKSEGIKKSCSTHNDCYDQREPQSWCTMNENQSWTNKGCHCDRKEQLCIIERLNHGKLEYTYCMPKANWKCV
ncbi:unnamed protein product, partial [Onchocerca ochengi]